MREKLKDNERLAHMLESIDNILEFVEGKTFDTYKNDKILRFAIINKSLRCFLSVIFGYSVKVFWVRG
jgi:uncharacterized protein with HEPN domain